MSDIYLDPIKKNYYSKDFVENVVTETDEFWKLHDFIKPLLILLNERLNIQPLYSKLHDSISVLPTSQSYLVMAYTKEVELSLIQSTLPYFMNRFNEKDSRFYYRFIEPEIDNAVSQSRFKMGCHINPEYYNINHLRMTFECWDKKRHKLFWQEITSILLAL